MSEEIKTCDCKRKCIEKLKEFTFIAGAVFVGGTLAILLSANLLKPKCPCPPGGMMRPYPAMERPLPPPPPVYRHGDFGHRDLRGHDDYGYRGHHKDVHRYRGPQGGPPPEFKKHHRGDHAKFKKHFRGDRAEKAPVPEK